MIIPSIFHLCIHSLCTHALSTLHGSITLIEASVSEKRRTQLLPPNSSLPSERRQANELWTTNHMQKYLVQSRTVRENFFEICFIWVLAGKEWRQDKGIWSQKRKKKVALAELKRVERERCWHTLKPVRHLAQLEGRALNPSCRIFGKLGSPESFFHLTEERVEVQST